MNGIVETPQPVKVPGWAVALALLVAMIGVDVLLKPPERKR